MNNRTLGRTGWKVSEISFGAWAIGGSWGEQSDEDSLATLHRALDLGINFIDTADVYGDGRSERLIARLRRERREDFHVTTKAGRRLSPHTADGYNAKNLSAFVERSLQNLATDCLDLVQLHCPPTEVYYRPEVFGAMDDLVKAGKIRHYGVSVEKVEEALKAIEYPNVQTIQIIFNMFRTRPAELFFTEARRRHVGILARVPLASGMLSGKLTAASRFAADDHRNFNRQGEAFDRGETFSGVDYDTGLRAVEQLRPLVPPGATLAQLALRWILMFDAVSCVIPGGPSCPPKSRKTPARPPSWRFAFRFNDEVGETHLRRADSALGSSEVVRRINENPRHLPCCTRWESQRYIDSRPLTVDDLELDGPGPGEVLVEIVAAGLCHFVGSVGRQREQAARGADGPRSRSQRHRSRNGDGRGRIPARRLRRLLIRPDVRPFASRAAHRQTGGTCARMALGGRPRRHVAQRQTPKFRDSRGARIDHHNLGVSAFSEFTVCAPRSRSSRLRPISPLDKAAALRLRDRHRRRRGCQHGKGRTRHERRRVWPRGRRPQRHHGRQAGRRISDHRD